MRILPNSNTGDMGMNRRDFLKICWISLAGVLALRGIKLFDPLTRKNLHAARFYKSADTLLG